ncbi:MAG: right-handed parallel beta-helix repeat-containing protein, partial [Synergistota bacterium]|nr:right-handed parallel beta-helix repeat-containing protein [Synergistota bacterium]
MRLRNRRLAFLLAALFFVCTAAGSEAATAIRVTKAGGKVSPRDGSSWERALNRDELLARLSDESVKDVEFWLAGGVYNIRRSGGGPSTFRLRKGVSIYGGFKGDESSRDERDPSAHVTVLSGNELSCNAVTIAEDADETTVLDGVRVMNGDARNHPPSYNSGGGVYIEDGAPTVSNCLFLNNKARKGGAVFCKKGSPRFVNCVFDGNTATEGRGFFIQEGSAALLDCSFISDSESGGAGGALVVLAQATVRCERCEFSNNKASAEGSAVRNQGDLELVNCTFSGNLSSGAVYNNNGAISAVNCTFANNTPTGGVALI